MKLGAKPPFERPPTITVDETHFYDHEQQYRCARPTNQHDQR
jgi:hypothetical protein